MIVSRFACVQGGPIELLQPKFDNYALSVHYYNQNDSFVQGVFRKFVAKADAWNVPLFVGEFAFAAVLDRFINVLMVCTAPSLSMWHCHQPEECKITCSTVMRSKYFRRLQTKIKRCGRGFDAGTDKFAFSK